MSLVAPNQTRSVDPHAENRFNSAINRFTRIFTGGSDYLLFENSSFLFDYGDSTGSTSIVIDHGIAIKDDVVINITEDNFPVDFSDEDYYLDEVPGAITTGWYYVVLYYNYSRSLPPPVAYYRILRDTSIFETYKSNYLFLAAVHIISTDNHICDEGGTDIVSEDDQYLQTESGDEYICVIDDMKYYDPTNPTVGKRDWLDVTWIH